MNIKGSMSIVQHTVHMASSSWRLTQVMQQMHYLPHATSYSFLCSCAAFIPYSSQDNPDPEPDLRTKFDFVYLQKRAQIFFYIIKPDSLEN